MEKDDVLMESELVNGNERTVLDLSATSRECRTPTPELDSNFIAWRNPVISIDEDSTETLSPAPSNDYYESPEQVKDSIQKDFEFIKKYAIDAEPDVLHSLLSSEVDNPNRVELVMCDLLGLPNAQKLVEDYKKSKVKAGDKRSCDTMANDTSEVKKRKLVNFNATSTSSSSKGESSNGESLKCNGESSNSLNSSSNIASPSSSEIDGESSKESTAEGGSNQFLPALRDMFPDADGLFLISESQHLKDWEECSRFINTVMLSGLYPKKGGDDSWKQPLSDSDDDITEITEIRDTSNYRSTVTLLDGDTDEEEPVEIKRKKPKAASNNTKVPEDVVVEISSDSTEPYDVPLVKANNVVINVLEDVVNDDTPMNSSQAESTSSDTTIDWNKQVADELDYFLNDGAPPAINFVEVNNSTKNTGILPQPNLIANKNTGFQFPSSTVSKNPELLLPRTTTVNRNTGFQFPSATVSKNPEAQLPATVSVNKNTGFYFPSSTVSKNPELQLQPSTSAGNENNLVSSTSEINKVDNTERELLELLAVPGPSTSTVTAKKTNDPVVAEAEEIVEKSKKILEAALQIKKEKSSLKTSASSDNLTRSLFKKINFKTGSVEAEPIALEAIVPDIDDKKDKIENPDSSSSTSVPTRIKTPPPGPSGLQRQVIPRVEIDEEAMDLSNGDGNTDGDNAASAKDPTEDERKTKWVDEQAANLERIFPNSDPTFLRAECMKMECSDNALNEFVFAKLENNDMPTRAEYEKRIELEELQNRYTKNFNIEDFLKVMPDPWTYFSDKKRNAAKYKQHSFSYLKSEFRKHYVKDITEALKKNNDNLYLAYQSLKKHEGKLRTVRRSEWDCTGSRPGTLDIQFLQEVAFIENEEKIKTHLENLKLEKQLKFEEAKRTGSLLECQCCFDDEVLVEDTAYCPNDHIFCKDCVIKCVEVEMGNGRCQFNCLAGCDSKFTLASLQSVLKPELFSKVIQANQLEEIKAAGIEDLVQCPFCNYATIMPPEEKVMTCLNPECLKESCRLCKELNHIPLRCEEVEKSEDVKLRTYIENKMTEALVRTCYKCNKKFVKEDGCNKMTCTCGARMCYVCRKPVTDYSHFNGQGGTDYNKCPLYSTNDELHVDMVKRVAEEAKAEVLKTNPQKKLVHDPTKILPERRNDTPMPGMVLPPQIINPAVHVAGHHRMMMNMVQEMLPRPVMPPGVPGMPPVRHVHRPPVAHRQNIQPMQQEVQALARALAQEAEAFAQQEVHARAHHRHQPPNLDDIARRLNDADALLRRQNRHGAHHRHRHEHRYRHQEMNDHQHRNN